MRSSEGIDLVSPRCASTPFVPAYDDMTFATNVARAISLSVVWGALLVAHFRRRRQDGGGQHATLPIEGRPSDQRVLSTYEDIAMNGESEVERPDTDLELEDRSTTETSLVVDDGTSLIRRVLSVIGSFVSPSPAEEQAVIALVDRCFIDSMNIIRSIALSLEMPTHLPESFHSKLPFRRSGSNNGLRSLMEELELLTFYSKSNRFLNAVAPASVSSELVRHTVDKLENTAIYLLAAYYPVDELEACAVSDLSLLLCLDVPASRDLTPFPSLRPKDQLLRFNHCQFQFASFLANLSLLPEAVETLSQSCLKPWLDLWSASQDIRLQLLSTKIRQNVLVHKYFSGEWDDGMQEVEEKEHSSDNSSSGKSPVFYLPLCPTSNSIFKSSTDKDLPNPPVIYGPDVFKLDKRDSESPPPEIDIIFVNGMLGSVFHTWRQRDHCNREEQGDLLENEIDPNNGSLNISPSFPGQVSCWPQAWLSEEFPEARILGVNANLKPFIWNPICPAEKSKRRIDQRARDILEQLLMAGVGRRPIIWIAHSAGGILTKEVLKLSSTWFSDSSTITLQNRSHDGAISSPLILNTMRSAISDPEGLYINSVDLGLSPDSVAAGFVVDPEAPTSVASQTKGVIFLSVPHRGNQSMMFLYHFPMVFTLTPEARQLQQNNESIMGLHNWFIKWSSLRSLQVLNMIEKRETVINRWYSVHLVQSEPQDAEFADVVLVDTNHTDICKPKDREDEVYVRIAGFIHRLVELP